MSSRIGVVGDVHGETSKLISLVESVKDSVDRLVFVGDYVDRGPDSRGVLDYLIALQADGVPCTFIAGNHDMAFRAAVVDGAFAAFLQMGGAATIRSYLDTPVEPDVESQFRAAVPRAHVDFLDGLVRRFELPGELLVAHSPANHTSASRSEYGVFGHAPQRNAIPHVTDDYALIDTGCGTWPEGRLTCLFWPSRRWVQRPER